MILVQLNPDQMGALLKCTQTKKRGFKEWNIENLLNEAIYEFYERYYATEQEEGQ